MKRRNNDIRLVDLVRGIGDSARQEIQLGTEVPDIRWWQRVADVGKRVSTRPEISGREAAKRMAKLAGRFYLEERRKPSLFKRIVANLVTADPSAIPIPIGVRSSTSSQHWLYTADLYLLDIKLETTCPNSAAPLVDGQIWELERDSNQPLQAAADDVTVLFLDNDGHLLGSTICDASGEFHSDPLSERPSKVHFLMGDKHRVEISIPLA